MHFRKLVFSVLAVFAIGQMASAQVQRCITPQIRDGEAFENWLSEVRSARSIQRLAATTYNIPIVVHIIHDGETVGQGDNISLDQVISQFVVINADFTRTNADANETPAEFLPVAAGMDISFVPAIVNEAGDTLAEPGVHRVNRNGLFNPPPYNSSYIDGTIKPATFWDPDKYFNIWVLDFSEALGYAQPPVAALPDLDPSADANLDGIVVRSSVFGTLGSVSAPWDKGRVTTHEAGHWLGLYHLWGQSNNNACGEDDYVADTPNQDEPSQFCGVQNDYCTGVSLEMSENYMDYTWDACMNLFTIGQVDRMTIVVENAPRRNTLLVSNTGGKFDQQITFSTLQEYTYGDDAFTLTAFSGSGLPVSYTSSDESVATVTGSNVTIIGAGSTVITASQEGNFLFNEAVSVQTLVVNKADQTITFETIPTLTYNDPSIELVATSSSSLGVTFSSPDTTVSIAGTVLDILGAGEATITANQGGDDNYNAASVFQTIEILKADQTITFGPIEPVVYGGPDFELSATTNAPGLFITTFDSDNTEIILLEGSTAQIMGAGVAVLTAYQAGNENYNSGEASQIVTVNKAIQEIEFPTIQEVRYLDSFVPDASSSSGLRVYFESDVLNVARFDGDTLLIAEGTGMVTITAFQDGNQNYLPAENMDQTINIKKAISSVTINPPVAFVYDTSPAFAIEVSFTSGVEVGVSGTGPIQIIDGILKPIGPGQAQVLAEVIENELFEAASDQVNFCVYPTPTIIEDHADSATTLYSNYTEGNTWLFENSIISNANQIEAVFHGDYKLNVDIEGCSNTDTKYVIPTAINERFESGSIRIYPNPTDRDLTIDFTNLPLHHSSFTILDFTGKQLLEYRMIEFPTQKIDINHLVPGVYFLQLIVDERPFTFRFVKE